MATTGALSYATGKQPQVVRCHKVTALTCNWIRSLDFAEIRTTNQTLGEKLRSEMIGGPRAPVVPSWTEEKKLT